MKWAKKDRTIKQKQARVAYAFITPAILLFVVFTVIPFILAMVFSFADYNGVNVKAWVGFDNFKDVFNDVFFMNSLKNVFIFAICYVPLSIIVSLLVAFLISQIKFKKDMFKIIFYIPSLTSGVAMIFVWKSILAAPADLHLIDGPLAMVAIIAISVWSGVGGNMLIYLAAMQGIPKSVYEASSLDGASKWSQFLHITLPLLRSSTYFIFTTTLIGSFQLFDLVYLLNGGNNPDVITPVVEIYLSAKQLRYGIGSAMSVILFVIIMVVTVITHLFVKENRNGKAKLKKRPAATSKNS